MDPYIHVSDYHIRCMDECTVSTQMTGVHISEVLKCYNDTAVPIECRIVGHVWLHA